MKELLGEIAVHYENYRGTGKLLVLFLAALLILYRVNRATSGKYSPALFILSIWTGIAYAFSLLTSFVGISVWKFKFNYIKSVIVVALLAIAVMLSGTRVISGDFFEPAENTLHIKTKYVMVMDRLLDLGEDESVISVIAYPGIAPYLKPYSAKFLPLYEYPKDGDVSELPEGARIVYNEFLTSVPDMKPVTDVGHKEDYEYILIDAGRYYPELKASEFGYELLDVVEDVEIYRRGGNGV